MLVVVDVDVGVEVEFYLEVFVETPVDISDDSLVLKTLPQAHLKQLCGDSVPGQEEGELGPFRSSQRDSSQEENQDNKLELEYLELVQCT